jgi:hypothetical protein
MSTPAGDGKGYALMHKLTRHLFKRGVDVEMNQFHQGTVFSQGVDFVETMLGGLKV